MEEGPAPTADTVRVMDWAAPEAKVPRFQLKSPPTLEEGAGTEDTKASWGSRLSQVLRPEAPKFPLLIMKRL
jgi:hypothetical protein